MEEVVRQLSGIGGGRSLGFGPNRVRSLADGVGQVLDEYLKGRRTHQLSGTDEKPEEDGNGMSLNAPADSLQQEPEHEYTSSASRMGDLCPECGEATMVNEEGCRKCYTCGYSEC
jgi:ribonucleoside-diphosphate reductase alpha chain